MWEFIKENLDLIIWAIVIGFGAFQTWRANKKGFWLKLKDSALDFIGQAEKEFGSGNGTVKKEWVIDQLVESLGKKFSPFTKRKVERLIDFLVENVNKFAK